MIMLIAFLIKSWLILLALLAGSLFMSTIASYLNPLAGWRTALIDADFKDFNPLRMAESFQLSGNAISRFNEKQYSAPGTTLQQCRSM